MKRLLFAFLLSAPLWAQPIYTQAYYVVQRNVTLASAAGVWTVQQAGAGAGTPSSGSIATSTFSANGLCTYTSSNGGGTGAILSFYATSGGTTILSPSIITLGSGFTSQPTTWTYTSGTPCSSGNGTLTTTGGILITKSDIFNSLYVGCPTATCTFTIERDGTAATTTAGTITNINPSSVPSTLAEYDSSNVGSGTILGTYVIQSGGFLTIDLTGIIFSGCTGVATCTSSSGGQTGRNLTVRTTSMSGQVLLVEKWYETL